MLDLLKAGTSVEMNTVLSARCPCSWRMQSAIRRSRPHLQPLLLQRSPSAAASAAQCSTVLRSLHAARRGDSLACCAFRNGLTAGVNQSMDEMEQVDEVDRSLKAHWQRFVTNAYDWGVHSTAEADVSNARVQAPLTRADRWSLTFMRVLQTLIILALAWHVSSWIVTSARVLMWRYSIAG